MAEKKEKKYVSDNARLLKEWDWEKNNELGFDPQIMTCGSNKKIWWKCEKRHVWQAIIANRIKGSNCPYCSGRYAISGYNDLQTLNPNLSKEWDYEKNNGLTPKIVTSNSTKKVWWKCKKGHEWQAVIENRNKGSGCPYCANQKVIKGENDLQTVNPVLANEWNFEKNNGLVPADVMPNSKRIVWWKCNKGHEWQAEIANRNNGRGCPFCANRKVLKGYNDLQTVNSSLAKEWYYERNNGLTPMDILPNSGKKVWWKCKKGHEWQAVIESRNKGSGCPVCNTERKTSFPEYAILYYLNKSNVEAVHSYNEQGYELDIYIPSKKIAIEYDGYYWHKDKRKKDLEKNQKCAKDGIILYRIRENLPLLNDNSIDYIVHKNHNNLPKILEEVLSKIIETNLNIDIERDFVAIENLREYIEKETSFLFSNPEIAKEWNYDKNGKLKPEHYATNSGKKVWWKCNKGHEWLARIDNRNKGHGCPYCTGIKVISGRNDLQTINPNLAKEWNYEKNKGFTPKDIMSGSGKKAWWKCNKGHEWQATIDSRNRGNGCPYCSGRYPVKGENDLQTVNPFIAKEWDYEKNNGLEPFDVTPSSNKKVWWKCEKGHEWQATIASRSRGNGCPYCSGQKVIKGENDLQTVNPVLANEWNFEKNNGLVPTDVMPNSGKKVWWKCQKGHEWEAIVGNRNKGRGCPLCAREKRKK